MNIGLLGLRSNSKRIPDKNIIDFAGRPLCYWILKYANESKLDKVYVYIDCEKYKKIVEGFNFDKVVILDEKIMKDKGDVNLPYRFMIEYPEIKFKNLVLLQAPCPFFNLIGNALTLFENNNNDSQVCVTRLKRFLWHDYGYPKNYKVHERPRTQDFEGELVEVGCCYITTRNNLMTQKNFLGGKIGLYEVPDYMFFEMDEMIDYYIMTGINNGLRILK
jgi:CMP-N-acetylneuraminic acid synthetase